LAFEILMQEFDRGINHIIIAVELLIASNP
jgi:hypothetical protein